MTRRQERALRVELLEDRRMLAVFTVVNNSDNGAGSLRAAIAMANGTPGADVINFNAALSGLVISMGGTEMTITEALTIDARPLAANVTVNANGLLSRIFKITATSGDFTFGGLNLTGGVVASNSSENSGGAIYSATAGKLTLAESTVSGNEVKGNLAGGGGIYALGSVTLTNSTVSGNTVSGNALDGGGILAVGEVTLTESTVNGNTTLGAGGGIWSLHGPVTAIRSSVNGNNSNEGGGIFCLQGSVSLLQSTVSGNRVFGSNVAHAGGVRATGSVTLVESSVSDNTVYAPNGIAGGIESFNTVTLTRSTVSGNALVGSAPGYAGGIFVEFGITITDSTVSDNLIKTDGVFADLAGRGGGIFQRSAAAATITRSTIAENSAAEGGGIWKSGGTALVIGSILSANHAAAANDFKSVGGAQIAASYSLIGTAVALNGGTNNVVSNVPLLTPLRDNGGPTRTRAPGPHSPAIDAGDPSFAPGSLDFDQRGTGYARVVDADGVGGARLDIGAYEWQSRPVYVVDSLHDIYDGDYSAGNFALSEAIFEADLWASNDVITFAPALSGQTMTLNLQAANTITTALTIDGRGLAARLTIDANQQARIFNIAAGAGEVTIAGLKLTGGRATSNGGGAIRSESTSRLTLVETIVTGNKAVGFQSYGGGISTFGSVSLIKSEVSANDAGYAGGGIWALRETRISGSTIAENITRGTAALGGGVYTANYAMLLDSVVTRNRTYGSSAPGGGVAAVGPLIVSRSTVKNNWTSGANSWGGGLGGKSTAELVDSTVSGNSTFGNNAEGGGLLAFGFVSLINSTFSGNYTTGVNSAGGAIWNNAGITLIQSTITGNQVLSATAQIGGVFQNNHPANMPFASFGSILSGNTVAGSAGDAIQDPQSALTMWFTLIGAGVTPPLNQGNFGTNDPQLGFLADNGGPTLTRAPLPGSPAIDAGDPEFLVELLPFDQRGFAFNRVVNGRVDIGAVETGAVSANFDLDGDVDGADFLAWQRGFGATGFAATRGNGNADGDNDVDDVDLAVWRAQFGSATTVSGLAGGMQTLASASTSAAASALTADAAAAQQALTDQQSLADAVFGGSYAPGRRRGWRR